MSKKREFNWAWRPKRQPRDPGHLYTPEQIAAWEAGSKAPATEWLPQLPLSEVLGS